MLFLPEERHSPTFEQRIVGIGECALVPFGTVNRTTHLHYTVRYGNGLIIEYEGGNRRHNANT